MIQDDRLHLAREIEAYCLIAGISTTTFGARAGQSGAFYGRLLAGKRNWPETIESVRRFMRDNPPRRRGSRAA